MFDPYKPRLFVLVREPAVSAVVRGVAVDDHSDVAVIVHVPLKFVS